MRIIVSSQALTPWYGGSAISEASLASHLAPFGEVSVLCRQGALDYSFARSFGLKEVREYHPNDVFEAWRNDEHWLSKQFDQADVFHLNGHWKWENYFFARLCRRKGIPYVLHPRGMLLVGHRRVALKRVFNFGLGNWVVRNAARVIALSQFEVAQFAPYRLKPGRVTVVPNGISMPDLAGATAFQPGFQAGFPYFLYIGRLEERKNLLFLVDVFAKYRGEGGQASLLLVGPAERDYDKAIEARVDLHGLETVVHILPPLYGQEKWVYMEKAHAVIYPTIDEPFGRVPFEAIAAGSFPIVPDESGSAEYLRPLLPGCIYLHQDAASLVRTMQEAEKKRREKDLTALNKAREWVRETLDWGRVARSVVDVYTEIIEEKKHTKVKGSVRFPHRRGSARQ